MPIISWAPNSGPGRRNRSIAIIQGGLTGKAVLVNLVTMTKRRLVLIASFPLAVVVIVGVLAVAPARPGVTKANFDRIELGMTLEEVERIFGRPSDILAGSSKDDPTVFRGWLVSLDSGAAVDFRAECVYAKQWQDRSTIVDRIRRWLHLD
jgi:hypothetical protein